VWQRYNSRGILGEKKNKKKEKGKERIWEQNKREKPGFLKGSIYVDWLLAVAGTLCHKVGFLKLMAILPDGPS